MDSAKKARTRAVENIYSLRKHRTLSYQIDQKIQANSATLTALKKPIKSVKKSKSNIFGNLKLMESLKSLGSGRNNISNLYRARLLPSMYLSTPADVLERLTNKVYNLERAKEIKTDLPQKSVSERNLIKFSRKSTRTQTLGKIDDTASFLDNTCKEILDDSKSSKQILKIATQFLSSRTKLTAKFLDLCGKTEQKTNFEEFQHKLKEAHKELVKHNKIQPKNNNKTKEI